MAHLRFIRDRRGYETTALVHTGGRRRGKGQRILYWFRTPPGVRVGRAPIDEDAIRLLEQHNPDVQFDWMRILKDPPVVEVPRREGRPRDGRERRREPRAAAEYAAEYAESAEQPRAQAAAEYAEHAEGPAAESAAEYAEYAERAEGPAAEHAESAAESAERAEYTAESAVAGLADPVGGQEPPAQFTGDELVPVESADRDDVPVFAADSAAAHSAYSAYSAADDGSASYKRLGAEGLGRLRARYAEVLARIAEQPVDEEARERLKERAERLNPDGWVTADEVTAALEQYETVFDELRGLVGREPRRRRRRR